MSIKTKVFNIADNLETDEDIREFLEEAATGTPADFIHALSTAAKAKGMTHVAEEVGITRAGLYKSLSPEGNAGFEVISKVVTALGCDFAIVGH